MNQNKIIDKESSFYKIEIANFKELLEPIFKKMEISFAYLFGSFSHDIATWWSDLDIAVSWPEFVTWTAKKKIDMLGELIIEIEKVVPSPQLDICIFEQQPIYLQFQIISGVLLYDNQSENRFKLLEKTMNEYYDYSVWWEKIYLPEVLAREKQ